MFHQAAQHRHIVGPITGDLIEGIRLPTEQIPLGPLEVKRASATERRSVQGDPPVPQGAVSPR